MIFGRTISVYLLFLSSAAASGSLRSVVDKKDEGCPHLKLFKEWSETNQKDYASEESMTARMKVWLENNSKLLYMDEDRINQGRDS